MTFPKRHMLWFRTDFLKKVGVLNQKEIKKLKKDAIDYLLVIVSDQEYQYDENTNVKLLIPQQH